MTLTTRTRLYFILMALLPALIIIAVIYFHSISELKRSGRNEAHRNLQRLIAFDKVYKEELKKRIFQLISLPEFENMVLLLKANQTSKIDLGRLQSGFDFIEFADSSGIVRASAGRPGFIGEQLPIKRPAVDLTADRHYETTEYDRHGRHAAFTYLSPINERYLLYAGQYIDKDYIEIIRSMIPVGIGIYYDTDSTNPFGSSGDISRGRLFEKGDSLLALLAGGRQAGFSLIALFNVMEDKPVFFSLLKITAAVALVSILIAILTGVYITGQTKKEINNLIEASAKIAGGDLTTPVMAYEEGEFSELADSLTDMKTRLKNTLEKLSTTEKTAAWKEIGQKIAHEVKNPLTPIAISIDDLKKSYNEKLPDFEKTLTETTTIIKKEISRLTFLLDQFVKFARMTPPEFVSVNLKNILDEIRQLYGRELESGRLEILNESESTQVSLDPEKIKQVLINLIKNGLESSPDAAVRLTVAEGDDRIGIAVEDTGPGFPQEILESGFKPYVSKKKGGFGLGLVICARIVHDHGGTIEIYNQKNGGGGVRISLPLKHG